MKLFFYTILSIFILLFCFSCNKKAPPTKPNETIVPDTTSHDFEWEITYFGDGASSYFKDVAIIDENNIWAVGEIYLKDSTGQYIHPPYNGVHLNGMQYILKKIPVKDYGSENLRSYPLRTIFSFNQDNIWFNAGAALIQFDGSNFHQRSFFLTDLNDTTYGPINKIWGFNCSNLYCVGNNGMIVYYEGNNWQKLASNTTQPINDIWGVYNPTTQQSRIFCVASDKYHGGEKKVLQIMDDLTVQEFDWSPQKSAHSVWFGEDTPLYVCGSGLHIYENGQWSKVEELPKIYKNRVRGNHQNDVFVAGEFGLLAHYNGVDWKVYDEPSLPTGKYWGLAVKGDLVVAVGWDGTGRAVICIGKRKK